MQLLHALALLPCATAARLSIVRHEALQTGVNESFWVPSKDVPRLDPGEEAVEHL